VTWGDSKTPEGQPIRWGFECTENCGGDVEAKR